RCSAEGRASTPDLEVDFQHSADHRRQLHYQDAHLSCSLGSTLFLLKQEDDNVK
ncbi:hypothetical protein LEMLEM_LOCUS15798, partial [Lemmus lemmus]